MTPVTFAPIPLTALADPHLTGRDVRILAALASFGVSSASCFPSRASIGERAGVRSTRNVSASLARLEKVGYITRRLDRGGRRTTVYTLHKFDLPKTDKSTRNGLPKTDKSNAVDLSEKGKGDLSENDKGKREVEDIKQQSPSRSTATDKDPIRSSVARCITGAIHPKDWGLLTKLRSDLGDSLVAGVAARGARWPSMAAFADAIRTANAPRDTVALSQWPDLA